MRPFNRCTKEVTIRAELHMSVDITWLEPRERGKAFWKSLLVYRVIRRQENVEEKIETSGCCEDAYVTNSNASTAICGWKSAAGPR
jgi:hypothetical protein